MNSIVLYCKSYHNDVHRVKILLQSIEKHNKDRIPFYISVPSCDVLLFKQVLGEGNYILITDEFILSDNLEQSWTNQQIVKSSFWKIKVCHNYVMIDSDGYFIRDFYIKDFIHHDNTPYTVMHEQKDLFQWTARVTHLLGFDPQQSFAECRQPVMDIFGRTGRLYDFGPSPVIWSCDVWRTLEEEYTTPNELTFKQLINEVKSEFSWYGEWLLVRKPIELWPIEPMFKVFHYLPQYQEFKQIGYTIDNWSKNYLGVVMQSSSQLPMVY